MTAYLHVVKGQRYQWAPTKHSVHSGITTLFWWNGTDSGGTYWAHVRVQGTGVFQKPWMLLCAATAGQQECQPGAAGVSRGRRSMLTAVMQLLSMTAAPEARKR